MNKIRYSAGILAAMQLQPRHKAFCSHLSKKIEITWREIDSFTPRETNGRLLVFSPEVIWRHHQNTYLQIGRGFRIVSQKKELISKCLNVSVMFCNRRQHGGGFLRSSARLPARRLPDGPAHDRRPEAQERRDGAPRERHRDERPRLHTEGGSVRWNATSKHPSLGLQQFWRKCIWTSGSAYRLCWLVPIISSSFPILKFAIWQICQCLQKAMQWGVEFRYVQSSNVAAFDVSRVVYFSRMWAELQFLTQLDQVYVQTCAVYVRTFSFGLVVAEETNRTLVMLRLLEIVICLCPKGAGSTRWFFNCHNRCVWNH